MSPSRAPGEIEHGLTDKQEDEYMLLKLYSVDLDAARFGLKVLRRYKRPDTRFAILRDSVMAYCRPFSGNKGRVHPKHSLKQRLVPKHLLELHDELRERRNGLVAHTEANARNPRVACWPVGDGYVYILGFAHGDWASLDRKVDQIAELVEAVDANLRVETSRLEALI